jgi:hypothetical protein
MGRKYDLSAATVGVFVVSESTHITIEFGKKTPEEKPLKRTESFVVLVNVIGTKRLHSTDGKDYRKIQPIVTCQELEITLRGGAKKEPIKMSAWRSVFSS